jgi:hypothetical protein
MPPKMENPFKVFVGQLFEGVAQNLFKLVIEQMGAPLPDAGLYIVTFQLISLISTHGVFSNDCIW